MFAMFGATILVPTLTGLSVSATLLFAGLGTLLFHFLAKGKVDDGGNGQARVEIGAEQGEHRVVPQHRQADPGGIGHGRNSRPWSPALSSSASGLFWPPRPSRTAKRTGPWRSAMKLRLQVELMADMSPMCSMMVAKAKGMMCSP